MSKIDNPLTGQCYVLSEILYHILGGKDQGWTPQVLHHEGGTHWFLKHKSGIILDATASQFATPIPYHKAKGCGFLTKNLSKRSKGKLCQTLNMTKAVD